MQTVPVSGPQSIRGGGDGGEDGGGDEHTQRDLCPQYGWRCDYPSRSGDCHVTCEVGWLCRV